jgi:hypothetical protein
MAVSPYITRITAKRFKQITARLNLSYKMKGLGKLGCKTTRRASTTPLTDCLMNA